MLCHIDWPKISIFFFGGGGGVVLYSSETSSPKTLNGTHNTEDQGTIIIRNACNSQPVDTAQYPRRLRSSLGEAERRNWLMIMSWR